MEKHYSREANFFNRLYGEKLRRAYPGQKLFWQDRSTGVFQEQCNLFVQLCNELVQQRLYGMILWFVHDVFCHRQEMDLVLLHDLLDRVEVPRNVESRYTLADLCRDYLLDIHEYSGEFYLDPPEALADDVDLFHDCPEDLELMRFHRSELLHITNQTLLRCVYCVHADKFNATAVDLIVRMERGRAKAAYKAECAQIDEDNRLLKEHNIRERQPYPSFTAYERDRLIPGMLLTFAQEAELQGNVRLCYSILRKYVFPVLEAAPWDSHDCRELPGLAAAADEYAMILRQLLWRQFPNIEDIHSSAESKYWQRDFYYEALGLGNAEHYRYATSATETYCKRYAALYLQWANILERGGQKLKDRFLDMSYSFHILNTAYMLYFGGYKEDACRFLLRHYSDIGGYELRKPHGLILLVRCILDAPRLETANALYGIFSREQDSLALERNDICQLGADMAQFLRDAKAYLHKTKAMTLEETPRTWYAVYFGDPWSEDLLKRCDPERLQKKPMDEALYKDLASFTEMLTYGAPAMVGSSCKDTPDRTEILSYALIYRGESCCARAEKARVYYARRGQAEILRNIHLHLQNHLYKLQQKNVQQAMEQVTRLKAMVAQNPDPDARETLLEQISKIAEDLVSSMQGVRLLRPEVEREITQLRESFEIAYFGQIVDLMQKLPEDVREDVQNYLVTSNMVYRMMEKQNDDSLDYSAALISMTKALEMVMEHIYSRVEVRDYEGFEEESRSYYFDKWGRRKEATGLESYIRVLQNETRIKAWNVQKVLDLSILQRFWDLTLTYSDERKNKKVKKARFIEGEGSLFTNAGYLQLALSHICQNYRNRSAHTETITIKDVSACKELLIDGQKLLWVMLAILKEAHPA